MVSTRRRLLRSGLVVALAVALAGASALAQQTASTLQLGPAETVAPGVDLFRVSDRSLVGEAGPISVLLLRIDPASTDLRLARALARKPRREPVLAIARRHGAVAAINAGFFNLQTGAPTGVLKVKGALVRCPALPRAALAIERAPASPSPDLLIDRVACATRSTSMAAGRPRWWCAAAS